MSFDPVGICRVLVDENVEFVVLGGFGAIVHGSPHPTEDFDAGLIKDMPHMLNLVTDLVTK